MRLRKSFAIGFAVLAVAGTVALTPPSPAASTRHSGTVLAVDPGSRTITMQEIGVGMQSRNQIIKWAVEFAPDARIELVKRSDSMAPAAWPGGFVEAPISPGDLRPGDFISVEGDPRGGRLVARSVVVVRPTPE